jgi:hypothetical protein
VSRQEQHVGITHVQLAGVFGAEAMSLRTLTVAIAYLVLAAPACAADVNALLFPLSGEIRLRNPDPTAVPFVFYSISSDSATSGALNSSPTVWRSITDNYDLSGNGFIDPSFNWTKISTTSTELTEGVFSGPGGSLAAYRSVSLGRIWNPNIVPWTDLDFEILQPDTSPVNVTVSRALDGDYNFDHFVDNDDYLVWRQNFGSTTNLDADGDINGIVDAADYNVWLVNFGAALPAGSGAGLALSAGGTVPEPNSAVLITCAAVFCMLTARGRAPRLARIVTYRCSPRL